jgi:hypothetical protein
MAKLNFTNLTCVFVLACFVLLAHRPQSFAIATAEADEPNVRYNIIFRQGVAPEAFHKLVQEVKNKHNDGTPFRAEIVRTLLNMKMITVRNPSPEAIKYFHAHQKVKFVEEIKDNMKKEL